MAKMRLIAFLTLIMISLNFQGFSQKISSVVVSGFNWGVGNVRVEIVNPDYSVEIKDYSRKEERNLLVEIKKELDLWLNKGFTIEQSNSTKDESTKEFRYTYILVKKENLTNNN